ncbi:MAG: EamA family transporter [Bacilli bacterium]|nr:EamA family transporter [Bacilli bacterium]
MNLFDLWETWVIIYLISAVLFAQTFKLANRNMKNAGALTILLEFFTALFAILFLPFFKLTFPKDSMIYIILFIVSIIYAITDRLNIEARYGLEPSTFSVLKQLSTVFMIFFGILFFKEKLVITRIVGATIIIGANLILAFERGKIRINKYFMMSIISNFLFAIAMLINVNISDNFNLAFYTIITVSIPALFIKFFGKYKMKDLRKEWNRYHKGEFLIAAFSWCFMLISSVKAYQLGDIALVAPIFTLTSIINAMIEFFVFKNKNRMIQKLVAAILLTIGVILVKI